MSFAKLLPQKTRERWSHNFIVASAGTGKTYTIENMVLRLLLWPAEKLPGGGEKRLALREILIVTYTEKATRELKDRVRRIIEGAVLKIRAGSFAKDDDWSADAKADGAAEHLEDCLNRFDEASIYTIHGFCRKHLSELAFESRVSMELEVGDEAEILREVVLDWLRRDLPGLAPDVQRALLADGADKLLKTIAAVAGKLMPHDEVVNPFDACAGMLAEAAAGIRKAKAIKAPLAEVLKAGKIPGKGARALSAERLKWFACVEKALDGGAPTPDELPDRSAWLTDANERLLADLCPELLDACRSFKPCACRDDPALRAKEKAVADCRAELYKRLQGTGVQTYNDMILQVHARVTEAGSPLRDVLRERFRFGLIDEFQDTNRYQWEIFRSIFVDDNVAHPLKRVLWVVGDPKQSIFSFQGSDVGVSLDAIRTFQMTGAPGVTLGTNYRSSDEIVASYNTLFSSAGWFYPPYQPVAPSGVPRFATSKGMKGAASVITSHWMVCDVSDVERAPLKRKRVNAWTVGWIRYLLRGDRGGPAVSIFDKKEGKARPLSEGDICVLVETNRESAPLMAELRALGIRSTKEGETGLFASDECLQAICLLEAIDAPDDEKRRRKAMLTFFFGFAPGELPALADPDAEAMKAVERLLDGWRRHARAGRFARMMESIFEKTAVVERLARLSDGARRLSALRQIRGYALKMFLEEHQTLGELAMHLRSLHTGDKEEREEENTFHRESSKSAVQFMSLHKGKGLEFPVVFLPTGAKNRFNPDDFLAVRDGGVTRFCLDKGHEPFVRLDEAAYREERQRLWYVGITRAAQMLFTVQWGDLKYAKHSSSRLFLQDAFAEPTLLAMNASIDRAATAPEADAKGATGAGAPPPAPPKAPIGAAEIRGAKLHLRGRKQTSYSSLAHGTKAALFHPEALRVKEADEPEPVAGDAAPIGKPILPRGRHTGDALHQIFESLDFALAAACADPAALLKAEGGAVRDAIVKALKRHRIWNGDDARALEAAKIIWRTLCAQIPDPARPGETFRLCDVAAADRTTEIEYHCTFARDGALFPATAAADGTVLGYIDLVVRRGGAYYVLDWKSNTLPSYDLAACDRSMQENKYTLQAALYARALERALKPFGAPPVGGAIYLFVRGIDGAGENGIWTIDRAGIDRACDDGAGGDAIAGLLARDDSEADE